MSFEIPGFSFSRIAAADFSGSQFHFVDLDTTAADAQAKFPSDDGRAIGVMQNKPVTGAVGTIMHTGISKAVVGTGGCTAGDNLEANADGTVEKADTSSPVVAIALKTGAQNAIIPVLLRCAGGPAA